MRLAPITLALVLSLSTFSLAQTRPARPGGGRGLDQLRSAIQSLDLTDPQKAQIKAALTEAREKMQASRKDGDVGAAREQVFADLKNKVTEILTPAQRDKLRDVLTDRVGERSSTTTPTSRPSEKQMSNQAQPSAGPDVATPSAATPTLLKIGDRAPSFTLSRSNGPNVSLSQFWGKVVLVVFAAESSPTFREHAAGLEQLRKDFNSKLNAVVIYTKEPHAKDQWEVDRNKDNGVEIAQAQTMADRNAAAKQLQQSLKLTVPVVVDTIDNATASAYGAESDTAYLINRDGTVAFRQKWFDPYGMRRAIESTLAESK